ncbi:hypothetical protein A2634_01890 [Candidatus Amesbacteria bacterium RIFCSPHIGHO2_01_FULL_48_32]|uniref:Uncharacterized protein n=1 Tax=Candidatus Amesbacteria bacterium RIFCSPLOWO2_01_FULL_48_25 TaxID=1797259 RepID=A0A1F4ZDG2_9BACT|nr:MAG: hypothetical protein A2634_01890 [Candidatus Amesbacteria bacterium RIFCSPHIGHO2_01_FULL_48_32]OGD04341.1 MAG: hypothetical protein A2989_04890 [Candidatus Amesbacteria bacterium RIFCSPLOWO2_01_FULL_48_25]HJZ06176.1 hypothetical protein [Patescibacteria group bacterium]
MVKVSPELRKFGMRSIALLVLMIARGLSAKYKVLSLGFFLNNLVLFVGWAIGYFLSDLDDWYYALITRPHELDSQRVVGLLKTGKWREAREMVMVTRSSREKLPVHNILTGLVVGIVGWWVISSSGSFLGAGVVLGLSVRLWIGLVHETDYQKWYWVFARKFTATENRIVVWMWAGLIGLQGWTLIRI